MKLVAPVSTRLEWWDRTPLTIAHGTNIGVAGGTAITTMYSYTVPANRKAHITGLGAAVNVQVAATNNNPAQAWHEVIPLGGATAYPVQATTANTQNLAAAMNSMSAGPTLLAGDQISGQYVNTATGGTVNMSLFLLGTEFDA